MDEISNLGDTVSLGFVWNVVGESRVTAGGVVSRTANSFPFPNGFRALHVTELDSRPVELAAKRARYTALTLRLDWFDTSQVRWTGARTDLIH